MHMSMVQRIVTVLVELLGVCTGVFCLSLILAALYAMVMHLYGKEH